MTPEQQRAIAIAQARKRKAEAERAGQTESRNPDSGRELAGGRDQVEALNSLDRFLFQGNTGRANAALLSAANSSTLGTLDNFVGGMDRAVPGSPGQNPSVVRGMFRDKHPVSSTTGDIAGFLGPGGLAWNAGETAMKALPQLPGKAAPYAARLAGLAGLGGAESAVYQATVDASNKEADSGSPVTLPQRLEMGKEGATNPLALAAGPLSSLAYRGGRQFFTGRATPKSLQPGSTAPSLEALEGMKNEAYKLADDLGVTYAPDSFANMVAKIENRLAKEGIDPDLHRKATANLRRIQARVGDKPMTLQELDQIRQLTRRDVVRSSTEAGEQRMGMMVMDEIDNFISEGTNAIQSGQAGSDAIQRARALNTVWRKSQTLADAAENAELRAASTGSGGNAENALRQEIRKIYQNPKKVAGFNEAERAAMRKVVEGDSVQNFLRLYGKLSPAGNALMASIGLGASTASGGVLLPLFAGAMGAKHLAQKGIRGKFNELDELVRSGATELPMKNITPGRPPGGTPPQAPPGDLPQLPGRPTPPVANAFADPQLPPGGVRSTQYEMDGVPHSSLRDAQYKQGNAGLSLAGQRAKTANLEMLEQAKQLEQAGSSVDDIFAETGWYRGYDKKKNWRFEISDANAKLKQSELPKGTYRLEDVMDFEELYAAYPDLRKMKVKIKDANQHRFGSYDALRDRATMYGTPELDGLLHEVGGHAVQRREGFGLLNRKYFDSSHEAEARMLQNRSSVDPQTRSRLNPTSHYDIATDSISASRSMSEPERIAVLTLRRLGIGSTLAGGAYLMTLDPSEVEN